VEQLSKMIRTEQDGDLGVRLGIETLAGFLQLGDPL
jgi:hypothetical protein